MSAALLPSSWLLRKLFVCVKDKQSHNTGEKTAVSFAGERTEGNVSSFTVGFLKELGAVCLFAQVRSNQTNQISISF